MRAGALAGAFLLAAAGRATAEESQPLPADRPVVWSLAAGYGFSVHVNRGRSEEQLFLFEPGVAVRLSARLEWVAEAHVARFFRPTGTMLGVMPIGARLYVGNGSILPYVSVGAGAGWTNLTELDEIDRRFNFLLQGSVGVRGALGGGQAWTLEARLSHVSNAGTAAPNLGLNCVVFLAGWRF
jgi:hypothetical protein